MAIPHVIEWHEGAPEKLEAGMLVQWADESLMLIGHSDELLSIGEPAIENWKPHVLRWSWAIKPHELTWAASMAKRQLAK